MLLLLINVLIIVVVGAICFYAIDKLMAVSQSCSSSWWR
jgi:hypothetical protein